MEGGHLDYAENLKVLFQHTNGVEIGSNVFNLVKRPKTLEALLQYRPRCRITSEMFETFAKERSGGPSMVKIVVDQEPHAIPTPAVIVSFLRKTFSVDYDPIAVNTLRQLLDRNRDIEITDTMLTAVNRPDLLDLLLSRRPNHPVSDAVLGQITPRIFGAQQLLGVVFKHDPTLKVGLLAMRACLEVRRTESLELLLQQDPSLVLPSDLPMILNEVIRKFGKRDVREVVDILVQHGKTLDFTPEMWAYIEEQSQLLPGVGFKKMFLRLEKRN
jgi:hypothetical protein